MRNHSTLLGSHLHRRVFSRGDKKSCTFVAWTSEVSTKTDFSLIYMPLSSKRSVTGALQASDAGSSPASGTSGAFKSLELAESKYKTKNSLW